MRTATDLPPFVHRKRSKGKTYYYFAIEGVQRNGRMRLVRLPDITDPTFKARVAEYYQHRSLPGERKSILTGAQKVYFIGGESGPIKIGLSRDPDARCREMKIGSPSDYRVLASVIGGCDLERAYHSRFEYAHLRGEWFERHPEIEAEIERLNKTRK